MDMSPYSATWAIAVFDIDGVLRDVGGSYRRAIADTVEHFTQGAYRPTPEDIDRLKGEGIWNNDWDASEELIRRYFVAHPSAQPAAPVSYETLVAFFQDRYRGGAPDAPDQWTGYILQEPLLADLAYFEALSSGGVAWGFFSGATRGSASFVLERRMGLPQPCLIAMEDAPGKPDPTGLQATVTALTQRDALAEQLPVIYVGDTVADMQTVIAAQKQIADSRSWVGVGVLPPHVVAQGQSYAEDYTATLVAAGATTVVSSVTALTPTAMKAILDGNQA